MLQPFKGTKKIKVMPGRGQGAPEGHFLGCTNTYWKFPTSLEVPKTALQNKRSLPADWKQRHHTRAFVTSPSPAV